MSALPWLTLSTIIWLQAIAGTNTDFPAYSSELKSRLHITQFKLNNLAVASDAGKLLGWCAGLAAKRLPLWAVPAIGAALGAVGYGVQFLFFCRKITSLSYTQFFFLNVLNGNSICWLNVTGYRSVMRQFLRKDHGAVIALTTSYMGLTVNIYLALAQVIVGRKNAVSDKSVYLLLNAVTPAAVALLVMPTVAAMREKPRDVKAGLVIMFVIAGVTGAYAVVDTMVPAVRRSSGIWPATVLLVMVAVVIVVPVWKVGEWVIGRGREEERDGGDVEGGGKKAEETAVEAYKISNTGAIAVLMVFMSVSFFLLLSSRNACLFVSTAIIGLGSGAISSIAVSVSSELFGQENFSVNHNIVISNIPIGSFLFGSIAALIYDKGGVEGGRGDRLCFGMECYSKTFIIWGCICSFGTILSFVLYSRTRNSFVSRRR
ncbi:protein NUCLEAR FUSION DEFECTIVE 4-like [Dendrobium catenatum]|uniref:protein NUCLEAR FUSION DEFECTIVE 4-like n=1 Tax=Dendrobium catenatum TaxID=906689 RepID=UPI00109F852F|nr:protein NUCLEAR FUSION DEFECTIVE 4-like [Dendrobium catenatum]